MINKLPYGTRWVFMFLETHSIALLKNQAGVTLVEAIACQSEGKDYQIGESYSFNGIEHHKEWVQEWASKYFD